jgi:3-dehydro-L-gulonate 2-dehydrogenase
MINDDLNIRIDHEKMKSEFLRILLKVGFSDRKAEECAEIFTTNSIEGVYSHGVNRFGRFIKNVREGYVIPDAEPTLVHSAGSLEQWNGNLGPGPLNAVFATDRAISISDENGIGMVALANTNHWMRAGYYGWRAAKKGYLLISWTNTCPNMPAWGAKDPRLGNNPFLFAIPYKNEAIVLDFAMTQFSYGKMETIRNNKAKLPYPGGFNINGELTDDPGEILKSWRPVPIGYWKGSGLSLLLDIFAVVLSGGQATHKVKECDSEHGVSQVFIAVSLAKLSNFQYIESAVNEIITDLLHSEPENADSVIHYPGESVLKYRLQNLKNGIPVNKVVWEKILSL